VTVLVAGALHLDVVLSAPHLPAPDETVTGSSVQYICGGKGGNQAIACARLGGRVHFAGRAGRDGFGGMLREGLAEAGVDTALLQEDPGPSGMSAAIVDAQGDYGAVIVSAANLNIDPDRIDLPAGTRLLLLQNEIPEAVNLTLARKARAAGAQVWLNAAPARPLPRDLWTLVDLLFVNRIEAAFYDPLPEGPEVMLTRGAEGVRYAGQDWPARRVDVVSTHGAGDMFIGALAALVSAGRSIPQAINPAQNAAAWHVSTDAETRAKTSADALRALVLGQPSS
jgi:ribokinase